MIKDFRLRGKFGIRPRSTICEFNSQDPPTIFKNLSLEERIFLRTDYSHAAPFKMDGVGFRAFKLPSI